jgi:ComF family protein
MNGTGDKLTENSLREILQPSYTYSSKPHGSSKEVVFSSSGDLNRAQRALKSAAQSLFSVLFPSDCRLCHAPLTSVSALPVCNLCLERVVPLSGILCDLCGEKLISSYLEADPRCGLCRRVAPPFQKAVAYGAYEGSLRDLIHLFKYQHVKSAAPLLGGFLNRALAGTSLPAELLVVAVPLAKTRRRDRGFNQAEEIARAFVRRQRSVGIELNTGSLVRTRDTASQTGLTRHQRRLNLRGAFAVTQPERIRDRSILLVDDVMTTGTTAGECARVLLRAGAKQVFVATAARATKQAEISLPEQGVWAKPAHA